MATVDIGSIRRAVRKSPVGRLASGGSSDPAGLPRAGAPMSLSELVDWHTTRTDEARPVDSRHDDGWRPGRHKWRPTDPVAWRPASLPPLPAPPIGHAGTDTATGDE